jgi:predicted nucleic acid-binding protein
MILVDTPIWSLALRRRSVDLSASDQRLTRILREIVQQGRVQLLGSTRQEVLSGIREQSQFRRIRDYLRDFPDTPVITDDYEEAARASNQCRGAGIAASPVDMLICAVALRHDWEILTADLDFSRYRKVLGVRLLPAS